MSAGRVAAGGPLAAAGGVVPAAATAGAPGFARLRPVRVLFRVVCVLLAVVRGRVAGPRGRRWAVRVLVRLGFVLLAGDFGPVKNPNRPCCGVGAVFLPFSAVAAAPFCLIPPYFATLPGQFRTSSHPAGLTP